MKVFHSKYSRSAVAWIVASVTWLLLFLFYWLGLPYHFYYREQTSLFLWSWIDWQPWLSTPGALAEWLGRFLTQFFYYEAVGPLILSLMLVILTLSILVGYAILEVFVPRLFGNGQTLGKKVFGIALMRTNGVKINTICLFIRTILGKFTIETMIPVLLCIMIFFGVIGLLGPTIIGILLIAQAVLLIVTQTNSAIHDLIADTVVVDLSSQMMFNSELERLDYQKKVAAERAAKKPY